jgi:cytochrome c553
MRRALVLLVLAGCGGATPPPATALDASRANVQLADLEQGRSILLAKCSSCHHTPVPSDHPQARWPHFVADMAPKAKLDGESSRLVELYLVTLAGRGR